MDRAALAQIIPPVAQGSRVAVAVSGGVDSLSALVRLQQLGLDVLALHGLFLDGPQPAEGPASASQAVQGLEIACKHLGIPLHVADLRQRFAGRVVEPFARAYAQGSTPNPCAHCNREMKFGALLDVAAELGADRLATGHYARLCAAPQGATGKVLLAAAADQAKDQSYFLSLVPAQRLQKALFPLAAQHKATSIAMVREAGLAVPVPKESQDICFVPRSRAAYRPFLARCWQSMALQPSGEGPVLLAESRQWEQWPRWREIARHKGLWHYTEGQRKGLGIAWSEPLFVLHKLVEQNALVVGTAELVRMQSCVTEKANIFLPPELWPSQVLVRLRYRQQAVPASVTLSDQCLHIRTHEGQLPTAAGQITALYDAKGHVLAAGVIRATC